MRANAVMTRNVIYVVPRQTLREAWETMQLFSIRHLPVLDDTSLVGVVSDRDVLRWSTVGAGGELEVPEREVGAVMTPVPITCHPASTLCEVIDTMLGRHIDCLPVVDGAGTLVGIVTTTDLLALLRDRESQRRNPLPFEWCVVDGVAPPPAAAI